MGVDISVWRARIGSFNLSVRRFSGKRAKPTSHATNGLEVAVVAAIALLILAGDVDFNQLQQRNMDIRTTVGLKVETTGVSPSSAAEKQSGVLHAHFYNRPVFGLVQPDLLAVKLYSKGLISDTAKTRVTTMTSVNYTDEQTVTSISGVKEQITDRSVEVIGHYPIIQSVGMRIREAIRLQHEHPGQVCQQPIFSLITHHTPSPPVATSCPLISPATTVPYHSPSHTTTITTELPRTKTPFSHTGAALGLVECIAVVLFSLLILAGDIELNPGPRNSLKLDASKALFQLQEVEFPADLWNSLATGLMLGGHIEKFEGHTNYCKLQQLITYWTSNNEQASWQQLVDAVKGCGQLVKAKQLAEKVGANPPTSAEVSEVVVEDTLSSPPVKKRKSQPDDPVTNYAQKLKYQYKQPLPDEEKLLVTPSKYYINLAVISSESVTRQEADEFTRKTLHGLTEEVLQKKTPIALQDILKPGQDSKPVRCVLIEGAPGVGKSTLAWEICHKWEELECVKAFDLVLLVQLRERSAQEAQKLSDFFPRFRNANIGEILDSIGDGKGVLLVLDGFDELPHEQLQKDSIYIQLVKSLELPEATVIITSRPSVSADLMKLCQHNIDRRLEILGFTEEHVVEYAESVFSESEAQRAAFLQYIEGNPIIKGMMYLPLNAVIVTMIFKDSYGTDCPFPKTMTQLFDALTRSLIRRHLVHNRMITDDYCMPQPLQRNEDISKLGQLKIHDHPEISAAVQFVKLAKMAYGGLLNETYVFSCDGDFDHLGLMKKIKSLNDISVGPNYSFCFLHLTLQEYLSAIHIFLLSSTIEVPSSLGRRDMVLRFLAGLCIHGDDCLYQIVRTCLGVSFNHVELHVVRCVYECDNIVQKIPMIKYFFDGQNFIFERSSHLLYALTDTIVLPFDYYLIGYCISRIGGRWNIAVSSQVEVDLLVQGLGSDDIKGELHVLKLSRSLQLEHAVPLLELFQAVLHCLKLTSESQLDATILRKYISPGSALRKLDILNSLQLSFVLRPSSLNSLTIQYFNPNFMVSATDVSLLRENSNLKNLLIPVGYLIPLAPALHDNTSLVLLRVKFGYGEEMISNHLILAQIIQKNHSLQQLELRYYQPDLSEEIIQAMVQVVEAAANSPSIKEISCGKIFVRECVKHSCAKRSSSAGDFLSHSLTNLMQSANPRDGMKSFIITFTD